VRRPLLSFAVLFCTVCFLVSWSAAWPQTDLRLHAESTLVVIPVTVTDQSNRFVLSLDKDNFSLFEDGVKQRISQFAGEDVPLSVGLLVDVSGSMGTKLAISQKAVTEFLKSMNTGDEAFLIEFGDRAELSLDFTQDTTAIEGKLSTVRSQGLTALLDAVHLGLEQMKKAKNPRKALLIVSDGGDNHSQYTATEIEESVREADVQIYAMGVFEPVLLPGATGVEVSGPQLLAEISEQTGGRAFPARSFSALPSIAKRIGIELRNEYILAYAPSNASQDRKYRKVEVKLQPPPGLTDLKARWRSGYYAGSR